MIGVRISGVGPAPGARVRARERATSCSGGGARTFVRTQPTLILNDLAITRAYRYPGSLAGSVTTIVTVFFAVFVIAGLDP